LDKKVVVVAAAAAAVVVVVVRGCAWWEACFWSTDLQHHYAQH